MFVIDHIWCIVRMLEKTWKSATKFTNDENTKFKCIFMPGISPRLQVFFLFSFAFHFQVKRSKTRLNAHICLFLLFFSLRFFVLQTFSYGKYYFGVKADSKLFRFFDCYANSHLENLQPNGKQNKTKSNEQNFKWISIDLCTT